MKSTYILCAFATLTLFNLQDAEVSAQTLPGYYGGYPVAYGGSNDSDDIGILLAILLLAARRGGCNGGFGSGCCSCCNCGNNQNTIPVPYPIPFPTNNPIIRYKKEDKAADTGDSPKDSKQIVNVITDNEEEANSTSDSHDSPKAFSKSSSSSSSNVSGKKT